MATTFYYHHRYGKHVLERLDYRITLIAHVKIKPPCQTPVHRARFWVLPRMPSKKKKVSIFGRNIKKEEEEEDEMPKLTRG